MWGCSYLGLMSSPVPRRLLTVVAVVICVAALVFVGVQTLREDGETPAPADAPASTEPDPPSLRDVRSDLLIPRAPFCETADEDAVITALGQPITKRKSYDNGDPVQVGTLSDVSHEYGCRWDSGNDVTARAWVFVPPVTVKEAKSMVVDAAKEPGCTRLPGRYGAPSVALTCSGKLRQQTSYRGLFGDTWLTCTLSAPAAMPDGAVADRARQWCTELALSAAG